MAVLSRGEYGVPESLSFSFPIASDGTTWHVVEGLEHDAEARAMLRATTEELEQERSLVAHLLSRT